MKRLALLLLLILTFPAVSQQVIRPSTADYRYESGSIGNLTWTNWYIDFFYADLPQGRTYRRQISETGVWRDSGGEDIVVPIIPDATASFTEGIDILPTPPPVHYFRLVVVSTNAPAAAIASMASLSGPASELSELASQPTKRGFFTSRKKLKRPIIIEVPPHGRLIYRPK